MFGFEDIIALPAYPTQNVADPTGCDSTGTIAAYLASGDDKYPRVNLGRRSFDDCNSKFYFRVIWHIRTAEFNPGEV